MVNIDIMISQIFQYLTKKQVNNALTITPTKSLVNLFLEEKNVSKIAVFMYNSIMVLNRPNYFAYRDMIAEHMNKWIWLQKLPSDDIEYEYLGYIIKRINSDFINEHKHLIKRPEVMYTNSQKLPNLQDGSRELNNGYQADNTYTILPENVYKDQFKISFRDNTDNITSINKSGKDMMPWDYQNWDVWKKQEVYADFDFEKYRSFRDKYGYVNSYRTIPRNVDRDPESFGLVARDPMRASLSDVPRAYDNDEYYRAKNAK
jgi:hypothetical protein